MKYLLTAAVIGLAIAAPAWGQDSSSTNTNTSSSSSSTSSQSGAMNQGVQATVNQISTGQIEYSGSFEQSVKSQVPLSVVGYGSFSQYNCQNAVGVGATSRVFSFVYNGPKGNPNCEAAVRSDQFGRESQLAYAQGRANDAEMLRAMSVWETCNINEASRQACLRLGLVGGETVVGRRGEETTSIHPKPNLIETRPVAQIQPPIVEPIVGTTGEEIAATLRASN